MTKQYTTKKSVLDESQKILGRSLRDVMTDDGADIKKNDMKIKIWKTGQCGGGYMFNVWLDEDIDEGSYDSGDGGLCTGSYEDAIDMACDQAKNLLKINRYKNYDKK